MSSQIVLEKPNDVLSQMHKESSGIEVLDNSTDEEDERVEKCCRTGARLERSGHAPNKLESKRSTRTATWDVNGRRDKGGEKEEKRRMHQAVVRVANASVQACPTDSPCQNEDVATQTPSRAKQNRGLEEKKDLNKEGFVREAQVVRTALCICAAWKRQQRRDALVDALHHWKLYGAPRSTLPSMFRVSDRTKGARPMHQDDGRHRLHRVTAAPSLPSHNDPLLDVVIVDGTLENSPRFSFVPPLGTHPLLPIGFEIRHFFPQLLHLCHQRKWPVEVWPGRAAFRTEAAPIA